MLIMPKGDIYFLADATVNIEPNAEELAEIAIMAAEKARARHQGISCITKCRGPLTLDV